MHVVLTRYVCRIMLCSFTAEIFSDTLSFLYRGFIKGACCFVFVWACVFKKTLFINTLEIKKVFKCYYLYLYLICIGIEHTYYDIFKATCGQ